MLVRTDPFRELDRFTQQVFGPTGRSHVGLPMDAWRDGEKVVVEFDLPGVDPESIDLDVERNVLTVSAERPRRESDEGVLASERFRGKVSRQLVLGENLDTDQVQARYDAGVLRLQIPVAEQAKPRKIQVSHADEEAKQLAS